MRRELLLFLGVVDLGFTYITYISQQYFSPLAMLANLALPLLASLLFVLPFTGAFGRSRRKGAISASLAAASALFIMLNLWYDYHGRIISSLAANSFHTLPQVALAVVLGSAMLYLSGRAVRILSGRGRALKLAAVAAMIALATGMAYVSMFGLNLSSGAWSGVDELAYNYYAASLFLHGQNPYTQSMKPILDALGTPASMTLNGTYEYAYSYPALSFLLYTPLAALNMSSFFGQVLVLIFICLLSAYLVYSSSGFDFRILVPLAAWLYFSLSLIVVGTAYLAVSVFLLLAYLYRDRLLLSGALLGLGASSLQLAWFALPFFYVLTLRQRGMRSALEQLGMSALAFLLVNGYFIALSPAPTLVNITGLLGTSKLPPMGSEIMQFFMAFYPEPYLCVTIISGLTVIVSLAILYAYNRSARFLLALVPMMLFFLSWRNALTYTMPYVPLLLAVHYSGSGQDRVREDALKGMRPARFALLALVAASSVLAVAMHMAYVAQNTVSVDRVSPELLPSGNGYYTLNSMTVTATDHGSGNVTASFYLLVRDPDDVSFVPGVALPSLQPDATSSFFLSYGASPLPNVTAKTKIFVFEFSKEYISGREISVSDYVPSSS